MVPFSRFLIRVLRYFRVHLCQRPDLDAFRFFYEFITAGDWYTFAHRKGVPSPSGDERSSLKNWKDNFFCLDDRCLSVEMVWRFKDQTMSFDLGDDFVFNKALAKALVENQSPIHPLPEHLLLWGRVCFFWGRGDRDWPVICTKRERNEMSLRDALKVPNFNVLDFDFDEQAECEVPFMKQVASAAQEIRPLTDQGTSESSAADATSSVPKPSKGVVGLSGSQAKRDSILDDVHSDLEVRSLDEALNGKLKSLRSDPLPMPKMRKTKKSSSHSSGNVITELDEHLSGGKSSMEEAALARSAPIPTFSRGYLLVNEADNTEVEDQGVASKGEGKTQSESKMVTFSSTNLDSSLGLDCFIDDEEDQVSSLPPSWFGPELMSFLRYADVFANDMEIDPVIADEKFVPD
ncbi:hypothetical protein Hanom_Chr11g00993451 [Helianthus anomalus]